MKQSRIFTMIMFVALTSLTGWAMDRAIGSEGVPMKAGVQSEDIHLAAIQQHRDRVTWLEQKIQNLENRLAVLKKKPYRDPKGFKRQGWKKLIGVWRGEMRQLQEQIVWHQNQRGYMSSMAKP